VKQKYEIEYENTKEGIQSFKMVKFSRKSPRNKEVVKKNW